MLRGIVIWTVASSTLGRAMSTAAVAAAAKANVGAPRVPFKRPDAAAASSVVVGNSSAVQPAATEAELQIARQYRRLGIAFLTGDLKGAEKLARTMVKANVPLGVSAHEAMRASMFIGKGVLLPEAEDMDFVQHRASHFLRPRDRNTREDTLWGTIRAHTNNLLQGIDRGFIRRVELVGVGFRAWFGAPSSRKPETLKGERIEPPKDAKKVLYLKLGFAHDCEVPIPDDLTVTCETETRIAIEGVHKQRVGEMAATLRRLRKPDPYKGKGVRFEGEVLKLKQGKRN